jgi:hypothetical protein
MRLKDTERPLSVYQTWDQIYNMENDGRLEFCLTAYPLEQFVRLHHKESWRCFPGGSKQF